MTSDTTFNEALLHALTVRSQHRTVPHTDDDITVGDIVYVDSVRNHVRRLALVTDVDRDHRRAHVHLCGLHPEDATNHDLVLTDDQTGYLPHLVVRGDVSTWVGLNQIWARDGQLPEQLTNTIIGFFNSPDRENLTNPDGYVTGSAELRTGRPLPLTFDPRRAALRDDLHDLDTYHQ